MEQINVSNFYIKKNIILSLHFTEAEFMNLQFR